MMHTHRASFLRDEPHRCRVEEMRIGAALSTDLDPAKATTEAVEEARVRLGETEVSSSSPSSIASASIGSSRQDRHAQPEVPFVAGLRLTDARELIAVELDQGRVTPSPVFTLDCMKMRCDHRYELATERVVDEDGNQALTARERAIIGFASASHLGAAPPGHGGRVGRAAGAVSGVRQRVVA
jgi:hypothetical protein